MIFDYETLRLIWWLLLGIVMVGFAVTDGFDLGVGALLTLVGKTDDERRVMINTIGPHWDGNQVWLITAGAGIFAAFPLVYATAFSGFYFALMLTLFALWMRPLGLDYRSKLQNKQWRLAWDWALFASGIVPALIFGVAFGNLIQGVPFLLDDTLKSTYLGSFFGLLNPFALLTGLVCIGMLLTHGAVWLQLKTDSELQARAEQVTVKLARFTAALFIVAGLWVAYAIDGYQITSAMDLTGESNPLLKTVTTEQGGWMRNFTDYPVMMLAPVLAVLGLLAAAQLSAIRRGGLAFVASALGVAGVVLTGGFTMFPFLLPNSLEPAMSLTIWDASASAYTLNLMTMVALVFVPIVLGYTIWSFWVMRGRLGKKELISDPNRTVY